MPTRHSMIDAVRGICLVNIFVNHLDAGYLSLLSPSRLGFSDSADLFVLLSGVSTALSFAGSASPGAHRLIVPLWRRALRLYAFNLAIIVVTLVLRMAMLAADAADASTMGIILLVKHGVWTLLWHGVTLQQTVGYSPVLRLHMAMMLFAPALVHLAMCRWWAPLLPTALLWVLAGHFQLVAPNSLSGTNYALTILPWTLLFAIGVVLGRAMTLGIPHPHSRVALTLALAYLVGYLLFSVIVVRIWPAASDWALTRNEHFWTGASKTYQSPLRVLHVLALVYVVLALPRAPLIRLLHRVRPEHFFCRLGRHSLLVFTVGAIWVVVANAVLYLAAPFTHGWALPRIILECALLGVYLSFILWITNSGTKARRGSGLDRTAGSRRSEEAMTVA